MKNWQERAVVIQQIALNRAIHDRGAISQRMYEHANRVLTDRLAKLESLTTQAPSCTIEHGLITHSETG